jgi:hypothetical protein
MLFVAVLTIDLFSMPGLLLTGISVPGLLFLSLRLKGQAWSIAFYALSLVLFGIILSLKWQFAITQSGILGGLLPDSDARGYYFDALRLWQGETFSTLSTNRPLSTAFIAVLFWVTDGNLQITLVLLTFLLATTCWIMACEIAKTHGAVPALAALAIMLLFSIKFVGTVFTENMGLAMAALGIALLWNAGEQKSLYGLFTGTLLLTLALFARAGAMFVLPAIMVWGILISVRNHTHRWQVPVSIGLALVVGYVLNVTLIRSIGSPEGGAFSNFPLTLYGQVVGGQGWQQFLRDYPELAHQDLFNQEFANTVYALTWKSFLVNPGGIVYGAVKSWLDLFSLGSIGQFSFVPGNHWLIGLFRAMLTVLWMLGLLVCFRKRQEARSLLLLFGMIGIFLSVPFIPPIDADRVRVYAATIPITAVLVAMGVHMAILAMNRFRWLAHQPLTPDPQHRKDLPYLASAGIVLILFVSVGPIMLKIAANEPSYTESACHPDAQQATIRVSAGAILHITDERQTTRVPTVQINDFRAGLEGKFYSQSFFDAIEELEPETILLRTIDIDNASGWLFMADANLRKYTSQLVNVCGQTDQAANVFYIQSFDPVVVTSLHGSYR